MTSDQENQEIVSPSGPTGVIHSLESVLKRHDPSRPLERLGSFLKQPDNRICADCCSPDPKWVSLNIGVIICIKCSGVHRSLGVHISKVLSVKLDQWTDDQVDFLIDCGGNSAVNMRYEAFIPENVKKPKPDSSAEERSDFIRRKYEFLQFSSSNLQIVPDNSTNASTTLLNSFNSVNASTTLLNSFSSVNASTTLLNSFNSKLFEKQNIGIRHAFRNSWRKKEPENKTVKKMMGMIEFLGLIKINMIRGTNLAIRDVMTSDPYVILTLGHQSVKTRVIKSSLNPIWNERLMLSIPDPVPPLKLQVYDKDTFKTDDRMGEAEIDIQPLVSAARAYESSALIESMQLGKWLASDDNTLVKDSIISHEEGKVKQDITIKLQNVERGELEIELECVALTQ